MSDPTNPEHPDRNAHIRSFVLRQGRVSNAQRRSHDELMPVWGIPYAKQMLDFEQVNFDNFTTVQPKQQRLALHGLINF